MTEPVTITWDDAAFQRSLRELRELGANSAPLMADIAEGLLHSTQDRFDTKVAPDGTPWAPLRPSTKRLKSGPGILVETGRLVGSLFPSWGADFAELSTPVFYARWHQDGTDPYVIQAKEGKTLAIPGIAEGPATQSGKGAAIYRKKVNHPGLPERPFMGVSIADAEMISAACEEAFKRAFRPD